MTESSILSVVFIWLAIPPIWLYANEVGAVQGALSATSAKSEELPMMQLPVDLFGNGAVSQSGPMRVDGKIKLLSPPRPSLQRRRQVEAGEVFRLAKLQRTPSQRIDGVIKL